MRSPVDGLVLSSPAFDPGLNAFQKLLLATLPRIAPNLTVGNGLDPDFLSHDPDVVAAYKADPMVHDRISARLARFIADSGPLVVDARRAVDGADAADVCRRRQAGGPARQPGFCRRGARAGGDGALLRGLFHEIFNELDAEPVFDLLRQWLDERF